MSHETIYRSLFIQARGALKQELVQHLRSQRRIRRSRHASIHGHSQGKIVDAISIRERPAEVEDRAIPGHWEGDLLRGARNSHVATLVERHSRFCMLVKVPGKDTATVVAALSQHVRQLPATLRRSLTWDRGLEMAQHKSFTMATDVQVYFCDPQSPWQRGSNENTNGLLRQYLPKKADLSCYFHSRTWTRSLCVSINGHEKRWDFKLRRINCKPVLHRPLETTGLIVKWELTEGEKTIRRVHGDAELIEYKGASIILRVRYGETQNHIGPCLIPATVAHPIVITTFKVLSSRRDDHSNFSYVRLCHLSTIERVWPRPERNTGPMRRTRLDRLVALPVHTDQSKLHIG